MKPINKFCNILRKRSKDHSTAIERLKDLPGMMMSIIRQELDSMVRVIYLLSISDLSERERLISQTLNGEKWTVLTKNGKYKNVTDRDMVELSNKLEGWTLSAYKFGCSFIHLSNYHDYSKENPFVLLPKEERENILKHMRYYHGGPLSDEPSFAEFSRYFPEVFKKISGNLECNIEDLENEN